MLKKLGALLLAVGLVVPYGCDTAAISALWQWSDPVTAVFVGLPVLAAVAYVLHTWLPPIARFHERHGAALHGLLRALYFILAGGYLYLGLDQERDAWLFWGAALLGTGALLYTLQLRGTKANRLPLLLLVCVALPGIYYFASLLGTRDLKLGGWLFTAGLVVAIVAEFRALRAAGRVTPAG